MLVVRASVRMFVATICAVLSVHGEELKPVFPDPNWERIKPEAVSMSSTRLEILRSWLKTQKTTAFMIVVGGRSIFEYGDVTKVSKVASVRKSILAMLYGKYVTEGRVELDK